MSANATRYGMVIDLSLCVACHACTVACKMENGVAKGSFRCWVAESDVGEYPNVARIRLPQLCNHCDPAPCETVCPTGASYRGEDGNVLINEDRCIGCHYCVEACQYDARHLNPTTGKADKCTYCMHRLETGLLPACVSTCISHARIFGDWNDPDSAVNKATAAAGKQAVRLENTSTVYILPPGIDRSALPPDSAVPGWIQGWKGVVQPMGKTVLGAAAGVLAVATAVNLSQKKKEEDGHDNQA